MPMLHAFARREPLLARFVTPDHARPIAATRCCHALGSHCANTRINLSKR
jgi:hypothetical protein